MSFFAPETKKEKETVERLLLTLEGIDANLARLCDAFEALEKRRGRLPP